ncbi:hypothetical protein BDP67DRAFT_584428 [Colletotrichum lupini]|nr:hypothetical protein BDP67DRAFT_584428 [Colletotrichum lupini]
MNSMALPRALASTTWRAVAANPSAPASRAGFFAQRCYATRAAKTTAAAAPATATKSTTTAAKKTTTTTKKSVSTSAASKKAAAAAAAAPKTPTSVPSPAPTTSSPTTTPTASTPKPAPTVAAAAAAAAAATPAAAPIRPYAPTPSPPRAPEADARPKLNPNSKEYRKAYGTAARKWTATMVAMPILLVTSYFLFDRLALGHEAKVMPDFEGAKKAAEAQKEVEKFVEEAQAQAKAA